MLPPAVMWIDPGGYTGLATLTSGRFFWADEFLPQQAAELIASFCERWNHGGMLGFERFHIGPQTHKLTQEPVHQTIEMIGVAKYLATINHVRILTPAAPDDRKPASPAVLRKLGLWPSGKDDAQSAAQHLVAWCLRSNNLPATWRATLSTADIL
jgi:hypothetical protein